MRKLVFLMIIFILGLFQVTFLDYFSIFGVRPDLLFISVITACLYFELKWALVFCVFAGALKDSLGAHLFGINTLLFPLWGYLIIRLSKKISIENNFFPAVFIFIAMLLNDLSVRAILFSIRNLIIPLGIYLRTAILESIYTSLISPLVFKAAARALGGVTKPRSNDFHLNLKALP